jgi:hypothetical protein
MARQKKHKFTFPQLAVMNWLLDDEAAPHGRILGYITSATASFDMEFWTFSRKDGERYAWSNVAYGSGSDSEKAEFTDTLGGSLKIATHPLSTAGFLTTATHTTAPDHPVRTFMAERLPEHKWAFWHHFILPTPAAVEWWNAEGKALYEAAAAERVADRKAVARRILIGVTGRMTPPVSSDVIGRYDIGNPSFPLPAPVVTRPVALATVVKVSETRVYVTDVVSLRDRGMKSLPESPVKGSAPNLYVDPAHILVDGITERGLRNMIERDIEMAEAVSSLRSEAYAQFADVYTRFRDRSVQQNAMHGELLADALKFAVDDAEAARSPASSEETAVPSPEHPHR